MKYQQAQRCVSRTGRLRKRFPILMIESTGSGRALQQLPCPHSERTDRLVENTKVIVLVSKGACDAQTSWRQPSSGRSHRHRQDDIPIGLDRTRRYHAATEGAGVDLTAETTVGH